MGFMEWLLGEIEAEDWNNEYDVSADNQIKCEQAIKFYNKVLELNPKYEFAWLNKSFVLGSSGKYDEAIECLDNVLVLNPENEDAWIGKGVYFTKSGRNDKAAECFRQALNINPGNEYVLNLTRSTLTKEERQFKEKKAIRKEFTENIDTFISISVPVISANIRSPDFKFGAGRKTQIEIKNTGKIPAKNISAEISSHQVWDIGKIAIKILSNIEQLKPDETQVIDIWIKMDLEGETPVEFLFKYSDDFNRDYKIEKELWINVSKIEKDEGQFLQPDSIPKTYRTSTFPIELKEHYTSPSFIGKGGFARVFQAKRRDGKIVAVKIPLNLDEMTGRSFLRESTSWQKLVHNNIVSLFDTNILPIPYLELEYVDGGSLGDVKKPLEIVQACKIIFYVAEGLKFAHNQGILHRDLKPNNILLTKELVPKITDWGLSKIMAESRTTSIMGFTPIYAAPEQVSPKQFGKTDARTDIYQLGTVFYELMTGKSPFEGESLIEISNAIVNDTPELPSSLNPEAKPVEKIILKCMAKNLSQRYQSAEELQKELAQYLRQECKRSLKESSNENGITKSRLFCADLVMFSAKLKDYTEVLKYLLILMEYARAEEKEEIENLKNELEFKLKEKIAPGEDFVDRIRVLAYGVMMK